MDLPAAGTTSCPACREAVASASRYCSSCGMAIGDVSRASTLTRGSRRGAARSRASDPSIDSRFLPGAMVAGRYRIVGVVGRGGMGEVYRADDLKLGQPVALKFLPEAVAGDEDRLDRFANEVRTARQISHPNVCRVYDIGEAEGEHYLSMEYVDGEDLGSLLRRIGRLPGDKAVQIARQLCAGLAAAHEKGILHRDLKPANVMIDGRGHVRLTDFGLAGLAEGIDDGDVRAGTPAYMAPEQLRGETVTPRSDLYSLGLVLYELFTGSHAFDASTPAELARMQRETTPSTPSSIVEGIDPAAERAILRCLESDPRLRPPSALAVAASLPGGDPLAAALAAGETPSPEMVAAAGAEGALPPVIGLALLALLLIGLAAYVPLARRDHVVGRVEMDVPPQSLAGRARALVGRLGYADAPLDSTYGFLFDGDYVRHVTDRDASPERFDRIGRERPSPVGFWYRQSPRHLVPANFVGEVNWSDPPPLISGMVSVRLDPGGDLVEFLAVPPQRDPHRGAAEAPDWSPLFEEAGLDRAAFEEVASEWNPPFTCDTHAAWATPGAADAGDRALRIEACGYDGRPAFFSVIAPWRRAERLETVPQAITTRIALAIALTVSLVALVWGILLARRNLRLGRGDRRGALRLAMFMFCVLMLVYLLQQHHVAALAEMGLVLFAVQTALLFAVLTWLVYVALEPAVRRLWPEALISWTRLMGGRLGDPRVGRDVLVGAVGGTLVAVAGSLIGWGAERLGLPGFPLNSLSLFALRGASSSLALLAANVANSVLVPIATLFLILLLRVLLRRQAPAVALALTGFAGIGTLANLQLLSGWSGPTALLVGLLFLLAVAFWAPFLWVLIRYGLLSSIVFVIFGNGYLLLPLTGDVTAWYAGRGLLPLALLAAVAIYGFFIARAGRPLIREDLLPG